MVEVPKLTVSEWGNIMLEIQRQPAWRKEADRACDYYDGNQIDAPTLQAMADIGMAPIVENIMAPTIDSVLGMEVKNRLDFQVKPEDDDSYEDVASAVNHQVNEAERRSKADASCSDAFAAQVKCGLGWVYVGSEEDPFKYPHKSEYVHRNEIHWDFKDRTATLENARWLTRRRWYDTEQLALVFPDKAELLDNTSTAWSTLDNSLLMDGGKSTDLAMDFNRERAWTILEQEWRDSFRKRLCLSEVWYRRWVRGKILKSPTGRVVEFDETNTQHIMAVQSGQIEMREATYSKVRLSWWVGPHCLGDIESPYKHGRIPYVPFFGKREDMTGIPYGLGRPIIPMQDEVNARNTKMIWLLAAKRVTMTEGVTDIEEARTEAARPDAVHVLSASKMQAGGVFKVESDFGLNSQQYQALVDKRAAIKNVAGVYAAFEGSAHNVSGVAADTMMQQTAQTLAVIYANQRSARIAVGELLMSNVIQEMGNQETEVKLKDSTGAAPKSIVLNQRTEHGMTNDVQRAMLRLSLTDIPSTASYRQQQSTSFAEIIKSLPPQMQAQLMDIYLASTDMPQKEQAIERIKKMIGTQDGAPDPQIQIMQQQLQELQAQLQQAQAQVQDKSADRELKSRELDIKEQDVALQTRVNAEAQVIKREQMNLQHANNSPTEAVGEMDDAKEVSEIVDQVTARITPALQQIFALIADMRKEDLAEDAAKKSNIETPADNRAEGGIENVTETTAETQ